MQCIYLNIRGVINNFNELEVIINTDKPDFICLSETHLVEEDDDSTVMMDNYKIVRSDSSSRHTGGVMIFIRNYWSYEMIKKVTLSYELWYLVLKLKSGNIKLYLAVLYRANGYLNMSATFFDDFKELMDVLCECREKVILVGDFNLNWFDNNFAKLKIENIICDNAYKQLVNQYTRIDSMSKTLIDFVIVNDWYNISALIDNDIKISDHESIRIIIKENNGPDCCQKLVKHVEYNKDKFRNKIIHSDMMNFYYLDCDFNNEIFFENLKIIMNDFVLVKRINVNNNQWFTDNLKIAKYEKVSQYKRAVFSNNEREWNKYRTLRNYYKNELTKEKNKYISEKIDFASDQRCMWRTIKTLVMRERNKEIGDVVFNNVLCEDDYVIAEKFNEYFVSSIDEINLSIQYKVYQNLIPDVITKFQFKVIEYEDLESVIKSMNSKRDFNLMNSIIFNDILDLIGGNLVKLINQSLTCGVFPKILKKSLIRPIEKIKNTTDSSEFRPVNMITIEAKIYEKIVLRQLEEYFELNNIISEQQSGFRNKHSCESLINLVIINWKVAMHSNKSIVAVFLDLRRAFETIDRNILLLKLNKYGIVDIELKWFESYLSNRMQRTKVNEVISTEITTRLGVPQGTVLGVFLFLIYINDIGRVVKNGKLLMFADDALLYVESDDVQVAVNKINEDLQHLSNWFKMNKMKLNINKTKCMVLNGNIVNCNITIDNNFIEQISEIKYLGVIIDSKLNFKTHLDYICKKIAKKLYFFRRIRNKLSVGTSIKIFNSIVKPHFEFCSTIMLMFNNEMVNRLQILQNKAMRIILKKNRFVSKSVLLKSLNWLNVDQRIKFNVLIFVFKIINGHLPNYLMEKLKYVEDLTQYNLRNKLDFRLEFFRNTKTQNSLIYKGLKLYNELPLELKNEKNLLKFKKKLELYVRENFN